MAVLGMTNGRYLIVVFALAAAVPLRRAQDAQEFGPTARLNPLLFIKQISHLPQQVLLLAFLFLPTPIDTLHLSSMPQKILCAHSNNGPT